MSTVHELETRYPCRDTFNIQIIGTKQKRIRTNDLDTRRTHAQRSTKNKECNKQRQTGPIYGCEDLIGRKICVAFMCAAACLLIEQDPMFAIRLEFTYESILRLERNAERKYLYICTYLWHYTEKCLSPCAKTSHWSRTNGVRATHTYAAATINPEHTFRLLCERMWFSDMCEISFVLRQIHLSLEHFSKLSYDLLPLNTYPHTHSIHTIFGFSVFVCEISWTSLLSSSVVWKEKRSFRIIIIYVYNEQTSIYI